MRANYELGGLYHRNYKLRPKTSETILSQQGFSWTPLDIGGGGGGEGKVSMGGLTRGDIDIMGGPNSDRLYHKLKVLLLL